MSAPGGAPRPAPRSNSMGPGASGTGIAMPQQSVSQTPIQPAPQTGQSAPPSGTMTTEVVNQIQVWSPLPPFWLFAMIVSPDVPTQSKPEAGKSQRLDT
ncbi:uncharacterized protein N7515_007319 [Penicillium bovifimosum]|uniref:Uncharacterized protein n=1 Tax=Penicillium bovifimosum TaxID=126998 RepID=A0A9W9GWD2_9EURO|nr:uncharacterized protein N7515_007319 [Penicillium bovifimosum]KAJ5131280.1 hypothetical protein N7515_007319 [Penicillium bovifimosum]